MRNCAKKLRIWPPGTWQNLSQTHVLSWAPFVGFHAARHLYCCRLPTLPPAFLSRALAVSRQAFRAAAVTGSGTNGNVVNIWVNSSSVKP